MSNTTEYEDDRAETARAGADLFWLTALGGLLAGLVMGALVP